MVRYLTKSVSLDNKAIEISIEMEEQRDEGKKKKKKLLGQEPYSLSTISQDRLTHIRAPSPFRSKYKHPSTSHLAPSGMEGEKKDRQDLLK